MFFAANGSFEDKYGANVLIPHGHVAFSQGEVKQAFFFDGNGYLVCVLQPTETRDALKELIDRPDLRRRLGLRSRDLARSYSVQAMVRGYENTLLEAVRMSRMKRRLKRRSSK